MVWENLTAACARCNSAKRDHPLLFFLGVRAGHWNAVRPGYWKKRAIIWSHMAARQSAQTGKEVSVQAETANVEADTVNVANGKDAP